MNISTLLGIVGCLGLIAMGIITGGNTLMTFWDLPSFLIVFGGSYLGLFTFSSISETLGIFGTIGLTFKPADFNEKGQIEEFMRLSEKARREGLLALEDELEDQQDQFMKKGMRLVVDGTDATVVRDLMEAELSQMQERHVTKIKLINMWGTLAPGLGMLGTVIGLIGMLKNLDDKSALGPNMAVALVTTFYGSMIANLLMIPWSGKLQAMDAAETKVKEMTIEGVLSIQAGDNHRVLGLKLLNYLNPQDRAALEKELSLD
jgi:chemotaxis protein MotA